MIKKIVSLVLVFTLCFSLTSIAGEYVDVPKKVKQPCLKREYNTIYLQGMERGMKIKNLKVSNNVCKVFWKSSKNLYKILQYKPKKIGTGTISGDIFEDGFKIQHFSIKVKFYKYKNPFKNYIIGTKDYAKKFKKKSFVSAKNKKTDYYRIKIKTKKGFYVAESYHVHSKSADIPLPDKLKLKKNKKESVAVEVRNKKQKTYEYYTVDFNY